MNGSYDEILERFEQQWASPIRPDIAQFLIDECVADNSNLVVELIQIDMERRWMCATEPDGRMTTGSYAKLIRQQFSEEQMIELLCWEYRVRNERGDCVSRRQFMEKHSGHSKLSTAIEAVSATMVWPRVLVTVENVIRVDVLLDRETLFGRQRGTEEGAWSHSSEPQSRRVTLSESSDASISRDQFSLSVYSQKTVVVKNTSRNRAFGIVGCDPLDAQQSRICQLPTLIDLGEQRVVKVIR